MIQNDGTENLNQLSLDKILILNYPLNQLYSIINFRQKVQEDPGIFANYLKNNQHLLQETIKICFKSNFQQEKISKQVQLTALQIMTSGEVWLLELIVGKQQDAVKSISSDNSSSQQEIYEDIITDKKTGKLIAKKSYNQKDHKYFNSYHYLSMIFQEVNNNQDNQQIIGYASRILQSILRGDFAIKIYNFLTCIENQNQFQMLIKLIYNPSMADLLITFMFNELLFQEKQFFKMQIKTVKQILSLIKANILVIDNEMFFGYIYFMGKLYESKEKFTIIGGIVTQQYGQLLRPFVQQPIIKEFVLKLFVTIQLLKRQNAHNKIQTYQQSCLNLLEYLHTVMRFQQLDEKSEQIIQFLSSKDTIWSTQYQFDSLYEHIDKFFQFLPSILKIQNTTTFIIVKYIQLLNSLIYSIPKQLLSYEKIIKYEEISINIISQSNFKGIILTFLSKIIEKLIEKAQNYTVNMHSIPKLECLFDKLIQVCLNQANVDLEAHSKKLAILFYTRNPKLKISNKQLMYLKQIQQQHRIKLYGNLSTKFYFSYLQKSVTVYEESNQKQQTDFNDSQSQKDMPAALAKEFPDAGQLQCYQWEQEIIYIEEDQLNPQQLSIQ